MIQTEAESQSVIEEKAKQQKLERSRVSSVTQRQLKRSSMHSEAEQKQLAVRRTLKYDLSKWRYAELRDTINTSCGGLRDGERLNCNEKQHSLFFLCL